MSSGTGKSTIHASVVFVATIMLAIMAFGAMF